MSLRSENGAWVVDVDGDYVAVWTISHFRPSSLGLDIGMLDKRGLEVAGGGDNDSRFRWH